MMKQRATFPTLDHVWLFAAVALIGLRPLLTPIPPHDFWWHLATGRLIVAQGSIPTSDSFSFSQTGQPFFNQGWLAQLLMYGLYQLGGVPLLLLVQAAVLALAYWILLRLCIHRSGAVRLSVTLLLLATLPLSFDNWNVRPQSYTFPLFAAFLFILSKYRLTHALSRSTSFSWRQLFGDWRSHKLWLLPPLMVLWVNLHGSFVLGGALIALVFGAEWLKRGGAWWRSSRGGVEVPPGPPLLPLLGWGAITAAALLLNPRGWGVLVYVRNLLGSSAVTSLVSEWAPPTTRDAGGTIFFLFLLLCIAMLTYGRRRPDLTDMLLAAAFLWLALGAVRNIVWFGMVATPLLAAQVAGQGGQWQQDRSGQGGVALQGVPALNWALIALLSLLLLLGLPWVKPVLDLPPEVGALLAADTPVQAVDCMGRQQVRPQRLFHAMGYGSYLIWALPEQPVFIDPRIELYPFDQWRDYLALGAGSNTEQLLERYRFDAALLSNDEQAGLLKELKAAPGWQMLCEDEQSTYLVRR